MSITVVEEPVYTNLTTLAKVKAALGISGTDQDTEIGDLIKAATDYIENMTGRTFALQTVIEALPSKGMPELLVSITPIVSVEYVAFDGDELSTDDWSIYDAEAGIIQKPTGFRSTMIPFNTIDLAPSSSAQKLWTVKYTGGYALPDTLSGGRNLPYDLERACIAMVKSQLLTAKADPGMSRYKIGETSIAWENGVGGVPKYAQDVINFYRRAF